MAKFQLGKLIIGFNSSVSGNKVGQMLRVRGLEYTDDFCVNGEFYSVTIPEGEEDLWIKRFGNMPDITSIMRVLDYSR